MMPTIAIAGRPNVGKSTLFNRLVGKQMALVSDEPGVTRDWRESEGHLFDLTFRVLDTAGLEDVRLKGSLSARTATHTKQALAETDVIILLVDGRAGLAPEDKAIARELRKSGKPIVLVANKCEGTWLPEAIDEVAALGFGDPIAISAAHGEGMGELYEALKPHISIDEQAPQASSPRRRGSILDDKKMDARLPPTPKATADEYTQTRRSSSEAGREHDKDEIPEDEKHLLIAVVGRPNAGKSTLVNKLIGEERMLTGPEPGLTRDAIPIHWTYKGKPVRLVDTAGLRKRARVTKKLEKMSGHETLRAIRLAHVVILIVDAAQPLDKQDLAIAHHVVEEGRALVLAVNKWDAVKDRREAMEIVKHKLEHSLSQVSGLPAVTISALKGEGLDDLMKAVIKIYDIWNTRVPTGKLNRWGLNYRRPVTHIQ